MSKSRVAALRKRDLQSLAASFNVSPDGLKHELEERVLDHLRLNETTLRLDPQLAELYPSPRKRSPPGSTTTNGGGGAAVLVQTIGSPKNELKLSPPGKAESVSGSGSEAASSPTPASRRTSARLNHQKPISIENSEDDDEEESAEEEDEDEEEEDDDEDDAPVKSTQMTHLPADGRPSWPHRISQRFVLSGASTLGSGIKSVAGQAKRATVSKTVAAKNAVVGATVAANEGVQTTLSSVCLINAAAGTVELAVLVKALYDQANGVIETKPIFVEGDTLASATADTVQVPFTVLAVQLLSSRKLFWNPFAVWFGLLVALPLVLSYYINFSGRTVQGARRTTDALVYNLARVLVAYFLAEHAGENVVVHASHVLSIVGKLPYIGGAVGILLALYTA